MWHLTKSKISHWAESLLHIHDTPERTAAAFGIGVLIGFSPFVGFHNVIGITVAFLFGLNRVAVLAGLWVNLPWFMAPYYTATTYLGAWLTGIPMPPNFLSQLDTIWHIPVWKDRLLALGHLVRPLLLPFTLGSLVACPIPGAIAYKTTLAFIRARKRHHAETHPEETIGPS